MQFRYAGGNFPVVPEETMSLRTPRRAVELEVDGWRIDESGYTKPPYVARFELVWPRPGIESVKRVLPLPDRIGDNVDWSDEDLLKKWLFKEDMEGRMILTASVVPLQDEETEGTVPQDTLETVGRTVARQSSLTWRSLSDLLELGGTLTQYLLSGPQKSIAEGHVVIEEQASTTLEIPLESPETLKNPLPDPTPEDHRPGDDHQDILKEPGDPNGYMNVTMSVWNE